MTFIRSNLFLTSTEKQALRKIAKRRKVSAATVIREILDAALGLPPSTTQFSHAPGTRYSDGLK
jgi:hypothetical protein